MRDLWKTGHNSNLHSRLCSKGEAGIAVEAVRLSTIPQLGIVNGVTELITKLAVVDN